jgi:hypothetical protein
MKKTLFTFVLFISLILSLFAQTDADLSNQLVGKWSFQSHRHELEITYKKEGTFQSDTETGKRNGTWKINDGQLIEISKGDSLESKIEFVDTDTFLLDGVFTYMRCQPRRSQ